MRTTKGSARTRAKRRIYRRAKGYRGGRSNLLRTAKETLLRSGAYAFRDRRVRKREFRRLWITRIRAACNANGISYSKFVQNLNREKVMLNRKVLADMAVFDAEAFALLVKQTMK